VNRTIAIALDLSPASYKFPLPIKTDHQDRSTAIHNDYSSADDQPAKQITHIDHGNDSKLLQQPITRHHLRPFLFFRSIQGLPFPFFFPHLS
jgi:hypothetical protein